MASLKEIQRTGKFKRLGAAITKLARTGDDYTGRDYYTGKELKYHMEEGDCEDGVREVPLGPEYRTPQWVRTTRT